jgi:hypothetical protein
MNALSFYFKVIQALEEIEAPYMIVGAWAEGHSAKHPNDIYAMLVFASSGLSDVELHLQEITAAATRLGADVAELWRALLKRAEREVQQHNAE